MNFSDIANQIKELNENIILIYAFNATGKTRLSVAYKETTKDPASGQHTGVYYNAFSEDLFVWDNDEDDGGVNIKLKIIPSSLNRFHSFLYENIYLIIEKLSAYIPKFLFRLNAHDDPEHGIESVTFFLSGEETIPIKISRGEERIFVWCFFLALLEVDEWSGVQDAHIFIDDPVSSLDEHNIFITADTIYEQIDNNYLNKKIIITTHHIGLFSILADRLTRGEKSSRYKRLTKLFILANSGNELYLANPNGNVFLYHLHLLQVLEEAVRDRLYAHHMVLLRQVLESVASFLGVGRISFALEQIGVEDVEGTINIINSLSHKNTYYFQSDFMPPSVESVFRDIFDKLMTKYQFILHAG
ncbi:AAA family ATPase [Acidithiobacillus sp. HP-11]|uniref:AAA family ATPase n=1 Tax=Acidithiobacillus sp. HP-11 TaxID=2697656 RepID=UPI00187B0C2F|nr:AAA family ATPase [Acidithiobacillus sp. HP-11]MBE7566640.1 AAA family ATPase [Acidithiobacillus sp. HP-11]